MFDPQSGEGKRALPIAKRYLQENMALREAVGAESHDALAPTYLGAGEHNLNYRFAVPSSGRLFVLRVNVAKQSFHDDQVAYEFAALQALEPSGRVPQPVYLDNSADSPGKGALVIGYCKGEELDFDNLRPGDLRCAAQLMADVHAVPVTDACRVFRPANPLRALFQECLQRFEAYRSSVFEDARVTRWVEKFIGIAQPVVETPFGAADCAHVINTEPLPSHFLIPLESARAAAETQGQAGRFCANPGSFIDWERPIVGEVAQDVAYFTAPTTTFWDSEFLFPADSVHDFIEEYWRAVDGRFARGTFDARFRAFRMMTALRSATWCCKALAQHGGGVGHMTEKAARKLPEYLSEDFMAFLARECFHIS